MTDLHLNHISARVPGAAEHFLINPFGMMYEEITASSLIKVDLDGKIISNSNPEFGVNLPGYVIHSAIHGARHDVGCVLHTHTNAGMAVSVLKCGLLPLTPDGDALAARSPITTSRAWWSISTSASAWSQISATAR